MSIYRPNPDTLSTTRCHDGWWVVDQHGPFDGPYATVSDANAAIRSENDDTHEVCHDEA